MFNLNRLEQNFGLEGTYLKNEDISLSEENKC